jgi:hypothetical protein
MIFAQPVPTAPEHWSPTAVMIVAALIALIKAIEALRIASKAQGVQEAQQGSIHRLSETNRTQATQIAEINRELPAHVQSTANPLPQSEPRSLHDVPGKGDST